MYTTVYSTAKHLWGNELPFDQGIWKHFTGTATAIHGNGASKAARDI